MTLCQYRDVFGRPGEGAHSYRMAGLAAVDVALTVLAAYYSAPYLGVSVPVSLMGWTVVAIAAHWLFCVDTALNKKLGL